MAADLSKENDVEVEEVRGGLGELSVFIDGQKLIDTKRLWYPIPSKVVAQTRRFLAKRTVL